MSAAVGRGGPERSPGLQPFSYAEAAKGRINPTPNPQHSIESPAKSPSTSSESRRPSTSAKPTTNGTSLSESTSCLESASNPAPVVHDSESSQTSNDHDTASTTTSTITSPTLHTRGAQEFKPTASGTSSPSFGTASTSTLPKEDDVSFTPNGSSDSTWDKQSEVSTSAEKSTQTGELNPEKTLEAGWEVSPSGFKELKPAPIPAMNVWQQRKAAQDAKTKATLKPTSASLSQPNSAKSASPNLPPTSPDPTPDQTKSVPKKRGSIPAKAADEATIPRHDRRRTTDGGKPRDEGIRKSGGFRSGRSPDKDETKTDSNPPPPVGDSESWPTPDLAQEGPRRSVSQKSDGVDKEKSPGSRPHGKDKWVTVPYVPTAIFNTPLPPNARRGGRGGARGGREGGGRGGHAPSSSIGGTEKAAAGSMGPPPTPKSTSNERGRNENTGNRAASLPAQSRRANSADAAANADQRKASQPIQSDRLRGDARTSRNTEDLVPKSADAARFPNNVSDENGPRSRHENRSFSRTNDGSHNGSAQRGYDPSMRHPSLPNDVHAHPRYLGGERRSEAFVRPSDFQREPSGGHSSRERGEPRPERGRGGGYRAGRNYGGLNAQPTRDYLNASLTQQTPASYSPSKSHSYNERTYAGRTAQQPPSTTWESLNQQARPQRGGNRSQSIPTASPYQPYPNGAPLPGLQTDLPPSYAYPSVYPGLMSAMPYQAYMADYTVLSMVQMQMDYYFSVDNLCKDMYLRKHMDSQGFVPLPIIADFRRIKSLTDNVEVLRMVCRGLKSLELRTGEDGIDRVRKVDGWEQWVLKMDERDPSAQNEGPAEIPHQPNLQSPQGHVHGSDDVFSPIEPPQGRGSNGFAMSPTSMHGGPFPDYASPMMAAPPFDYMNGVMQTPLSHATSEFVPNFPPLNLNDTSNRDSVSGQLLTDEMIDNVTIVVRKPGQAQVSNNVPPPKFAVRTTSQGSVTEPPVDEVYSVVDGRQALSPRGDNVRPSVHEERGRNGIGSPGSMKRSPLVNGSSPGFWVKEGDIPTESLDDGTLHEPYKVVRAKALTERQSSPSDDEAPKYMSILYNFWSHFLVDTFISPMYKEFQGLALEDLNSQGSTSGLQHLIQFYEATLTSSRVISTEVAQDFINLVEQEPKDENRPAFQKLRAIWRNGAFNLKSRKMIDNILDQELKAELEK